MENIHRSNSQKLVLPHQFPDFVESVVLAKTPLPRSSENWMLLYCQSHFKKEFYEVRPKILNE